MESITNTHDSDILMDCIDRSKDPTLRRKAVQNLIDEGLLVSIAKRDSDFTVRMTAILHPNLTSQDFFKELFDHETETVVWRAIVGCITDFDFLLEKCGSLEDKRIRNTILHRLLDLDGPEKIYTKSVASSNRCWIHGILQVTNENFLKNVIESTPDHALVALTRVRSVEILKEVAKDHPDFQLRRYAVRKLKSEQKFLESLLKTETDHQVTCALLQNITNLEVLESYTEHESPIFRAIVFNHHNYDNAEVFRKNFAYDAHYAVFDSIIRNPNFADQGLMNEAMKQLFDDHLGYPYNLHHPFRSVVQNPNFTDYSVLNELAEKCGFLWFFTFEKDQDPVKYRIGEFLFFRFASDYPFAKEEEQKMIELKDTPSPIDPKYWYNNESKEKIREILVPFLTDTDFLSHVAQYDDSKMVRKSAIEQLDFMGYST